jgi:phage shock protein A
METKVERAEALAEAYDRLDGRDPDVEELERQFDEQQRDEQLRKELESLQQSASASEAKP